MQHMDNTNTNSAEAEAEAAIRNEPNVPGVFKLVTPFTHDADLQDVVAPALSSAGSHKRKRTSDGSDERDIRDIRRILSTTVECHVEPVRKDCANLKARLDELERKLRDQQNEEDALLKEVRLRESLDRLTAWLSEIELSLPTKD
jgi:hypothetical protein